MEQLSKKIVDYKKFLNVIKSYYLYLETMKEKTIKDKSILKCKSKKL